MRSKVCTKLYLMDLTAHQQVKLWDPDIFDRIW